MKENTEDPKSKKDKDNPVTQPGTPSTEGTTTPEDHTGLPAQNKAATGKGESRDPKEEKDKSKNSRTRVSMEKTTMTALKAFSDAAPDLQKLLNTIQKLREEGVPTDYLDKFKTHLFAEGREGTKKYAISDYALGRIEGDLQARVASHISRMLMSPVPVLTTLLGVPQISPEIADVLGMSDVTLNPMVKEIFRKAFNRLTTIMDTDLVDVHMDAVEKFQASPLTPDAIRMAYLVLDTRTDLNEELKKRHFDAVFIVDGESASAWDKAKTGGFDKLKTSSTQAQRMWSMEVDAALAQDKRSTTISPEKILLNSSLRQNIMNPSKMIKDIMSIEIEDVLKFFSMFSKDEYLLNMGGDPKPSQYMVFVKQAMESSSPGIRAYFALMHIITNTQGEYRRVPFFSLIHEDMPDIVKFNLNTKDTPLRSGDRTLTKDDPWVIIDQMAAGPIIMNLNGARSFGDINQLISGFFNLIQTAYGGEGIIKTLYHAFEIGGHKKVSSLSENPKDPFAAYIRKNYSSHIFSAADEADCYRAVFPLFILELLSSIFRADIASSPLDPIQEFSYSTRYSSPDDTAPVAGFWQATAHLARVFQKTMMMVPAMGKTILRLLTHDSPETIDITKINALPDSWPNLLNHEIIAEIPEVPISKHLIADVVGLLMNMDVLHNFRKGLKNGFNSAVHDATAARQMFNAVTHKKTYHKLIRVVKTETLTFPDRIDFESNAFTPAAFRDFLRREEGWRVIEPKLNRLPGNPKSMWGAIIFDRYNLKPTVIRNTAAQMAMLNIVPGFVDRQGQEYLNDSAAVVTKEMLYPNLYMYGSLSKMWNIEPNVFDVLDRIETGFPFGRSPEQVRMLEMCTKQIITTVWLPEFLAQLQVSISAMDFVAYFPLLASQLLTDAALEHYESQLNEFRSRTNSTDGVPTIWVPFSEAGEFREKTVRILRLRKTDMILYRADDLVEQRFVFRPDARLTTYSGTIIEATRALGIHAQDLEVHTFTVDTDTRSIQPLDMAPFAHAAHTKIAYDDNVIEVFEGEDSDQKF